MIVAVLDTNVLASGFIRPGPPPGRVLAAWRAGSFTLVTSEHILAELARTFAAPYFRRRLTPGAAAANVALLHARALVVQPAAEVRGVATHAEDDLVLAAAAGAETDYLMTGDAQLLRLGAFAGVAMLTPGAFLALLEVDEWPG